METRPFVSSEPAPVGALLREWRAARRWSQLDLATEAGLSARHLSYVETGKSKPSREMVLRLADTFDMPLRERNALLTAAGYAPIFPETSLDMPQFAEIRRAIDFILAQQEPYPAFLVNRHWDVVQANQAAARVGRFMMDGRDSTKTNMLQHIFDPGELRPAVANWDEVAGSLLRHLHSLIASSPSDQRAQQLLDEVLSYPGVPQEWRARELGVAPGPMLTTEFRHNGREIRFFSTITTFGTPRDVTIEELHIECCFPVDEVTAQFCRELAAAG